MKFEPGQGVATPALEVFRATGDDPLTPDDERKSLAPPAPYLNFRLTRSLKRRYPLDMAIKSKCPEQLQLQLTSAVQLMRASLEPYMAWIEQTLGVPLSETLTLEVDCNPADAVAEELLQGLSVVSATKARNRYWRTLIEDWALPSGVAPGSRRPYSASASRRPRPPPPPSGNSTGKTAPSPSSCAAYNGAWSA